MTLTRRQQEYLDAIREHIERHGIAPTVRELAATMGVRHHQAVYDALDRLERKGYLDCRPYTSRGIRLVSPGGTLLSPAPLDAARRIRELEALVEEREREIATLRRVIASYEHERIGGAP